MGKRPSAIALKALLAMMILVSLSFPYTLYNGALYCNTTCADCVSALNNDPYSTVYLNSTLSSPGATCINNPANFSNKTFDCQGYSITGDRTSSTYGIYLNSKTNATIRNCTIEAFYQNARLYHTFNSTVTNVTLFNASNDCAYLYNFTNSTFSNSTLYNCTHEGMSLDYSVNSTIANNTIYEDGQQCVELGSSHYNTIEYNLFHSCDSGVDFHSNSDSSNYNLVRNNSMYNVSLGITIVKASYNTIVNNSIYGPYSRTNFQYRPISPPVTNLEYCDNIILDNTGPGDLPIYYSNETVNWDGLVAAQIILCDADNSVVTNSVVNASGDPDYLPFEASFTFIHCDNLTVSSSIAELGRFTLYSGNDANLSGNVASGFLSSAFSDYGSNRSYFGNNTAYDNNNTGFLIYSNNATLAGNTAYDNGYAGIAVARFTYYLPSSLLLGNSSAASLASNTVYGNKLGGILVTDSQNATLAGNNVYSNGYGFVEGYYSGSTSPGDRYFGIYLGSTYNISLSNNTIHSNNYYGIALNGSDDTNITRNNIYNNSYQVQVNGSNTLIYDNILNSTNSTQEVAVVSGGTNNRWNTTRTCAGPNILGGYCIGGNYYSNYTGIDTTRDGIGETSYTGTGITDYLPITDNVLVFMGDLDLNYDGYTDIVFSNSKDSGPVSYDTNSTIYWGSSSGFSPLSAVNLSTRTTRGNSVADLNNDGYLDIIFSILSNGSSYNANSTIYWGSSSGFSTSSYTGLPTHGAEGNSVADLNNDGYMDIVFSSYRDDTYYADSLIYWGSASGFSTSSITELPTIAAFANSVADLNNDGYLDIVFSNGYNGSTYNINSTIYWGSSLGFSPLNNQSIPAYGTSGNSVADLNNDGYMDIVFSIFSNLSNFELNSTIYWGSASGFSESATTGLPTSGAAAVSAADLNNDGYPDIIFSNSLDDDYQGNISSIIYWNSPSGFNSSNYTGLPTLRAFGSAVADLNNDSYPDIVFSNLRNGSSYESNSVIYWNSPSGFNSSNNTWLPTNGAAAVSTAIGGEREANTAYGTTQTLVPDFHTVMNQQLNGFIDLDIFFYSSGDYNLTVEGETSSVDVRIDLNKKLSIIPDTNWNGTVNNFRFAASRGSHTVYSNNFSIYVLPGDWVEEKAGSEPGCITDSDCAGCETCTSGECTPYGECFIDSDCTAQMGEGYTCDSCYCAATAPECTTDADCGEGEICSSYSCVASPESGCTSDSDCPAGYSCEDNRCVQAQEEGQAPGEGQIPGGECSSDNDCPPDQHCDGGTCSDVYCPCGSMDNHICTEYECCSDAECPQGYKCTNNECVEEAPEPTNEGEDGGVEREVSGEVEGAGPGETGEGEPGGVETWLWPLAVIILAAAIYLFWRRRE